MKKLYFQEQTRKNQELHDAHTHVEICLCLFCLRRSRICDFQSVLGMTSYTLLLGCGSLQGWGGGGKSNGYKQEGGV